MHVMRVLRGAAVSQALETASLDCRGRRGAVNAQIIEAMWPSKRATPMPGRSADGRYGYTLAASEIDFRFDLPMRVRDHEYR